MSIEHRWNEAWARIEGDYHCNLGWLAPEELWLEEQRRRRADLDRQEIEGQKCQTR